MIRVVGAYRLKRLRQMNSIPADWPVGQQDLEAVGWFLEYRSASVAARLRQLISDYNGWD